MRWYRADPAKIDAMARARPRSPRAAAGLGAAASAVLCVLVAVSCASPTQIVVEVFTDACPGSGKPEVVTSTGIAVGTVDDIASQRPASTHVGCESPTGVGTLTIYPSGANDDEIALKVLGGVEVAPDRCDPPGYAGCIVSQRTMRFIPHETQRVTVVLSLACLNRECPDGKTCDDGACIDPTQILADGGTNDDAERLESGAVDAVAVTDAPTVVDAADPRCSQCTKGTCVDNVCTVDCTTAKPCTGELCANGLPCAITCENTASCSSISATSANANITITCKDNLACGGGIACQGGNCDIECVHDNACNGLGEPISVTAATGTINCNGNFACANAKITCNDSTSCRLMCNPGGPMAACGNGQNKPQCTGNGCMGF